jgi:hypothetical protein
MIIPLPYGADTDWCLNVLAAERCTLALNGETYTLTAPRVVSPEIAEPLLPTINARLWHWVGMKQYLVLDVTQANSAAVASTDVSRAEPVAV